MTTTKYEVIVEYSNGKQETVTFDHVPTFGVVVKVPGTDKYGRILAVEKKKATSKFIAEDERTSE